MLSFFLGRGSFPREEWSNVSFLIPYLSSDQEFKPGVYREMNKRSESVLQLYTSPHQFTR